MKQEIENSLQRGEKYVAIHSLGIATYFAKDIVEGIKPSSKFRYKVVEVETEISGRGIRDFSKIWYRDEGENTFLLIKDFLFPPKIE